MFLFIVIWQFHPISDTSKQPPFILGSTLVYSPSTGKLLIPQPLRKVLQCLLHWEAATPSTMQDSLKPLTTLCFLKMLLTLLPEGISET